MEIIVNISSVITANYFRAHNSNIESVDGGVIVEQPLSISINGNILLSLMCTPVDLKELVLGFLYNEGIINSIDEIKLVELHPNNHMVEVWLNKPFKEPMDWRKTSGCAGGITAVNSDSILSQARNGSTLSMGKVISLGKKLFDSQGLYQKVRGVHASALSDGNEILILCEDIGRHNTLDKIAGKMLLEEIQPDQKILLTTGRISSEMLQKASRIGSSVLISRTSPTSLSIELAEKAGVTLIGYARGRQFMIYTNPQRVQEFTK